MASCGKPVDIHAGDVSSEPLLRIDQCPITATLRDVLSRQPGVSMKSLVIAAFLIGMTGSAAYAQNAPIEFRMAASDANLTGCRGLDAQLSRVHSVTLQGDKALLKLAGGISETLKQTSPGVYTSVFTLSGVRLDVVADASKSPKTLVVTEKNRGCRWDATTK